ncbi:MAG: choice-of-anchor B family protein [Armatimonadota bacterium]|nr:choice-of-anchor B family protein [Armatimonadota bacterium]
MRKFLIAAGMVGILAPAAFAQYTFHKIRLAAQIDLTTFNANSGNSCWGYVSPSGREYALMGLSNKLAAVEITDPNNPVWIDSVSHGSSTWADVKVYQNIAYLVTEREASGIQVIDLSDIDSGNISLIQTLMTVGRSHTISVDTTSGFLYTTGSRDSPGTTTCWNLANPANPVLVGVNSITGGTYVHESMAMTYPVGSPYAGMQVFFASSAFDGLMIWNVTNKNNPILIKSIPYPQLGYTHQAWISEDLKYVYLDDEFDETTYNIPSRTVVFNVESLENAAYVTSYTNGNTSIDHNLYVRDGYVFSSNYTSGLRIFSTHLNPEAPTEVGWFDTYPSDDIPQYEGLWSNYPFFPSGTVIGSDINRGLFIWDVTEATTRTIPPVLLTTVRGTLVSGNLASLAADDNNRLQYKPGIVFSAGQAPVEFFVEAKADSTTPVKLDFKVDSRATSAAIEQKIEFYNFLTDSYELINTRNLGTADSSVTAVPTGNLARFVRSDKTVRVRLRFRPNAPVFAFPYTVGIDQAVWLNSP